MLNETITLGLTTYTVLRPDPSLMSVFSFGKQGFVWYEDTTLAHQYIRTFEQWVNLIVVFEFPSAPATFEAVVLRRFGGSLVTFKRNVTRVQNGILVSQMFFQPEQVVTTSFFRLRKLEALLA